MRNLRPVRAMLARFLLLALSGLARADENPGDSLLPDFYNDPALSTSGIKLEDYESSSIDYFSGLMSRSAIDFSLPGNGGMTISFRRSYNSQQPYAWPEYTALGVGWKMHFGWLQITDGEKLCSAMWNVSVMDNPVLHMPDGSTDVLAMTDAPMIDPTQVHYRGKSGMGLICGAVPGGDPLAPFIVVGVDGTRYEFERWSGGGAATGAERTARWFVRQIVDRHGNWMWIDYADVGTPDTGMIVAPVRVTANDGRDVTLEYADGLLQRIMYADQPVVEYAYEPAVILGSFSNLVAVTLREELVWRYAYSAKADPGSGSMTRATNPFGGHTEYTWQQLYFQSGDGQQLNAAVVRVRQDPVGSPEAIWTYVYTPATVQGQRDVTTVMAPEGEYRYTHFSAMGMVSGEVWKVGLKERVVFTPNSGPVRTEEFTWVPYYISAENNKRTSATGFYAPFDNAYYGPLLAGQVTRIGTAEWRTNSTDWVWGAAYIGAPRAQTITMRGPDGSERVLNRRYQHRPALHLYFLLHQEFLTQALYPNTTPMTVEFNELGDPVKRFDKGFFTFYTYDARGNPETVTRGLSGDGNAGVARVTRFSDYYRGVARRTEHPDATVTLLEVDPFGRTTREIDRDGRIFSYAYDLLGRIRHIDYPAGNDTFLTYSARVTQLDRGAYRRTTTIDGFGRNVEEMHADVQGSRQIRVTRDYDVQGRVVFTSFPNSVAGTHYRYDNYNRLTRATHPGGFRTYDYVDGSHVRVTDENGRITRLYRDEVEGPGQGELLRIESPEGVVTRIERNEYGLPLRIEQGDGTVMLTRTNSYSSSLVLRSSSEPESSKRYFYYDHAGNVTDIFHETTPGYGRYQHNEYDLNDRVISSTAPINEWQQSIDGQKEYYEIALSFSYTPEGKPIDQSRTESIQRFQGTQQVSMFVRDSAWHHEYDTNGNLQSERLTAGGNQWQFDYTYDANDRLATLTYPGGETVAYQPDAFGWPTRAGNYATGIQYHETGQLAGFAYGNGRAMSIAVNDRYLVETMTVPGISGLSYDYDPAGNVLSIVDDRDATRNIVLRYDGMNRMTGADGAWGTGTFTYDKVGNITQKTIGNDNLSLAYDARNRLASVSGSRTRSYAYDVFGNIVVRNGQLFGYDGLGNLLAVPSPNAAAGGTSYQYDARGRRLATFHDGEVRYSLYANGDRLLYEANPAAGTWQRNIHVGAMLVARNEHYIACYEDIDGDGIPHCAEQDAGLDPYDPLDASADIDGDTLANLDEYQRGTGINDADTDDDGMGDGLEVFYGLDPKTNDAAGDPDGDGLPSGVELARGFNPNDPADGAADTDGDGLSNAAEYTLGTAWNDADSDNDGMGDGYEAGKGLNPLANDAAGDLDGDGMPNKYEHDRSFNPADAADGAVDPDGDGLTNRQEYIAGTNPRNADSDGDGMSDGYEAGKGLNPLANDAAGDLDGDGMPNKYEHDNGFEPAFPGDGEQDIDGDGLANVREHQYETDPWNPDTDGDGMPDGVEVANALDPLASDAQLDYDGDSMPNAWEVAHGLNPRSAGDGFMDPDGDQVINMAEYFQGTDPFVAEVPAVPQAPHVVSGDGKTWVAWSAATHANTYRIEWGLVGETSASSGGGQYASGRAYSMATPNDTLYWFRVYASRGVLETVGPRVIVLSGPGNQEQGLPFVLPAGCVRTQLALAGDGAFMVGCEQGDQVTVHRYGPGLQPAPQVFPAGARQGSRSGWRLASVLDGDAFFVWLDEATNTLTGSRYSAVPGSWGQAFMLENEPSAVHAFDAYADWAGALGTLYATEVGSANPLQYTLGDKPLGSTWFGQAPQVTRAGRPWHMAVGSRDHAVIGETVNGVDRLVSAMLTTSDYPVYDWGAVLAGSRPSIDRGIVGWVDSGGSIHAASVCAAPCVPVQAKLEASSYSTSFAYAGAGYGQVYWYAPGAIRYTRLVKDNRGNYSWNRAATLFSDAKLNDPSQVRVVHGEASAGIYWSNSAAEIRTSQSNADGTWRAPSILPVTGKVLDAAADVAGNQVLMLEKDGNYLFRERRRLPSGFDRTADTTPPVLGQSSVRSGKTTIQHVVTLSADEPANRFFTVAGGTITAGGANTTAEQRYTGPVTITFPNGGSATITYRGINMAERWSAPVSAVLQ
ncbi:MAG: DUF6531 domain-containing protein [Pseudomonadota bacterium]